MSQASSPKRKRHESNIFLELEPAFDFIWHNPDIWQSVSTEIQDSSEPLNDKLSKANLHEVSDSFLMEHSETLDYDPLADPKILAELDKQLAALENPQVQTDFDKPVKSPSWFDPVAQITKRKFDHQPSRKTSAGINLSAQAAVSRELARTQENVDPSDIPGRSWFHPSTHLERKRPGESSGTIAAENRKKDGENDEMSQILADVSDEMWNTMLDQVGGAAPPIPGNLAMYMHIEPQEFRKIRRFRTYMTAYTVKFQNIEQAEDLDELMHSMFDYLIQRTFAIAAPNSMVGVTVSHPALKDGDIFVPFCRENELSSERIIREIERVMQSNAALKYDSTMQICFTRIVQPQGSIRQHRFKGNLGKWVQEKCGHGGPLVWIDNTKDRLCLARSIVTAKAHLHRNESAGAMRHYQNIRRGDTKRNTAQKKEAKELMKLAGLDHHHEKCTLVELDQIQRVLPEYQIKVWDFPKAGCCVFRGPPVDQPAHVIHLFHFPDHFIPITRMAGFFEEGYYCEKCEVPYKQQQFHRCENKCGCCQKQTNCAVVSWIYCQVCNRYFKSRDCFNNHKQLVQVTIKNGERKESSVCKRLWKCRNCNQLVRVDLLRGTKHQCGFRYCSTCRKFVRSEDHYCYMSVLKEKDENEENDRQEDPDSLENLVRDQEQAQGEQAINTSKSNTKGWIFFDIESTQEKVVKETALGIIFGHQPNLVIVHKVCHLCKDNEVTEESQCTKCSNNYHQFRGEGCIDDFCTWLFQKEHKGYVVVAHNMKGYDGQFILNYLHRHGVKPEIIPKGLEIMKLEVDGIKILDSLNFMPLPLSSLPKAFGIEELKKGYFPHLFNKAANQNYEGPYPDPQDYGTSSMKPSEREKFFKWYVEQKSKRFDFSKELVEYCNSDVQILRKACLKYRQLFITETGIDPFEHCMTIASTCNRVFRKNFLQEETIGIVPPGGYSSHEKQSIIAKKWLHWIAQTQNINMRYVANGQEMKVGKGKQKYKVDGQDQNNPFHVYEFNGCLWHGCRNCFKNRSTLLPGGQKSVEEAYLDTIHRKQELIKLGFQIEEKWQCELNNELAQNPQMEQFFNDMHLLEPLSPRAAFYGGRTNASILYWKSQGPEDKARYLDVCSLYPYVCKYGEFPKGHPKVITENFVEIGMTQYPYKGVMECRILPPKQLLHPVLPLRLHGKLLFPLCLTCAMEQRTTSCTHTDTQRTLKGVWCTPEIYKALEKGYEIIEILQVWQYEHWMQYKRGEASNMGMFTSYIDCFVKHKQQASDWPRDCDRAEYLRAYRDHEGIALDPQKIEKNPGLWFLAKLCLNSFWGKFGQRNDLTKMEYFTDPAKYFSCVFDKANVIKRIDIVHENMLLVEYGKVEEYVEALPTTNPIIASFVTTHARLKLYSYLDHLGDRVLYYDTDSVIFLSCPDDDPPTGCYLGDLTDELDDYGPGSYIEEFIGAGPKNYAYAVRSSKDGKRHETLKCRGFSLNYTAGKHLTFKTMKKKVQEFVRNVANADGIPITLLKIRRDRDRNVLTMPERKRYGVVYEKRRVLENFHTKPFGYVD